MEKKERNSEIDIIKGLCMLAIVGSHAGNGILWFGYIFLYGFYFVAGYTFRDKPFKEFMKSKIRGLYLPFVMASLFGNFIVKILSKVTDYYDVGNLDPVYVIKHALSFNLTNSLLAPAWFVFPLFVILFLYYVLNKLIKNYYVIWGITFIVFIFGNCYSNQLEVYFWNNCAWLVNVCFGLFVFSCGYVLKKNKEAENILFNGKYSIDLFTVSSAILFLMWTHADFLFVLREGKCDNLGYNAIICFFGMYFLVYSAKLLAKSQVVKRVFSIIGRYSMPVMFFHIVSFSIVTLSVHYFLGLPFPEYWTKVYNEGMYGIISVIVGIAVPLIGGILYDSVKERLFRKVWIH